MDDGSIRRRLKQGMNRLRTATEDAKQNARMQIQYQTYAKMQPKCDDGTEDDEHTKLQKEVAFILCDPVNLHLLRSKRQEDKERVYALMTAEQLKVYFEDGFCKIEKRKKGERI